MLSATSKYAFRALLFLEEQEGDDYVPVQQVAKAAKIPPAYLSKIVKTLRENELLLARRGKEGGIRLIDKSISFHQICVALKDPVLTEHCLLSDTRCQKKPSLPSPSSLGQRTPKTGKISKINQDWLGPCSGWISIGFC